MSNLRSELTKKDRVLGLKEREIGRVYSKLKVCEEHITQLLKLNRNRSKLINVKREGSVGSFDLTAVELEHLNSSKKLLDSLVDDKVILTCARAVYDRKSRALIELNKDLVSETTEVQRLLHMVTADEDSQRQGILAGESNIDRITRELDVTNADLEEIASRIAALNKANNGRSFESLGKDVVCGLKGGQLESLAWDLLQEKLDALEQLRTTRDQLEEMEDRVADGDEKLRRLEETLQQSSKEHRVKLDQVSRLFVVIII